MTEKKKAFSNAPALVKAKERKNKRDNLLGSVKMPTIPSKKICTMMTDAAIADLDQDQYKQSWDQINDLQNEISNWIMTTSQDLYDITAKIRQYGCDNPKEFDLTVKTTDKDIQNFLDDFDRLKNSHAGKSGIIDDPFELTECIAVFENYLQFKTKFEGVMHHTLINFTEFALQAKDRETTYLNQQKKEEE